MSDDQIVSDTFGFVSLRNYKSCNGALPEMAQGLWYKIEGKGQIVDLQFNEAFTNGLILKVFEGQCDLLSCPLDNYHSFVAQNDSSYYITIQKKNGFNLNEYNFSLTYTTESPQSYSTCDTAPTLSCDSIITFDFAKYALSLQNTSCFQTGLIAFFKLKGLGNNVSLNFDSEDLQGYSLAFYDDESCIDNICLKSRPLQAVMNFSTSTDNSYLLALIKSNNQVTDQLIGMHITCTEVSDNSVCNRATSMTCDTTYNDVFDAEKLPELGNSSVPSSWFKISGDNLQHKIIIQAPVFSLGFNMYSSPKYDDNCDTLWLLTSYTPFFESSELIINTDSTLNYYIEMQHLYNSDATIQMVCPGPSLLNDLCLGADTLYCGNQIDIYTPLLSPQSLPCEPDAGGQWFIIVGNDSTYHLSATDLKGIVYVSVFSGDCDTLSCIYSENSQSRDLSDIYIHAKKNKIYYLRFAVDANRFITNKYNVECIDQSDLYPLCNFAQNIVCGDLINHNIHPLSLELSDDICGDVTGAWYRLLGNGETLIFPSSGSRGNLHLYKGTCNDLKCIYFKEDNASDFYFKSSIGESYYLQYEISNYYDIFPLEALKCTLTNINDECKMSDTLDCMTDTFLPNFENAAFDQNIENVCYPKVNGVWYFIEGNNKVFNFNQISAEGQMNMQVYYGIDCASIECINGPEANQLSFFAETGQNYYVNLTRDVVDSMDHSVKLSCRDKAVNSLCIDAELIECNAGFNTDFSTAPTVIVQGKSLRELWYKMNGNGMVWTIGKSDVKDLYYGYQLFSENCDSPFPADINANLTPQLNRKPLTFYAEPGKEYFIRYLSPSFESYIFESSCKALSLGDLCINAVPTVCDSQYIYKGSEFSNDMTEEGFVAYNGAYYSFIGDNNFIEINFTNRLASLIIYESEINCNDLTTIFKTESNQINYTNFFAKSGKTYYLLLYKQESTANEDSLMFQISCTNGNINAGNCSEAKLLECDTTFTTTNVKGNSSAFGGCTKEQKGDWFQLIGDGNVYTISMGENKLQSKAIQAYLGTGNCDTILCLNGYNIDNNGTVFSFDTEKGLHYFLQFASTDNEFFYYNFEVDCISITDNFSCANAISLACQDIVSGVILNKPDVQFNACLDINPGLYYKIFGTGEYLRLNFEQMSVKELHVEVITGDCVNGTCLYNTNIYKDSIQTILFETVLNQSFYVKITAEEENAAFNFQTSCESIPGNTACEKATLLECGQEFDISIQTPLGTESTSPCFNDAVGFVSFWYLLPKNDSLFELQLLDQTSNEFYIEILRGNCDNFICETSFTHLEQKIAFKTSMVEDYFMIIHGKNETINKIKFRLSCILPVPNDFCNTALEFNCGDTISGTTYLTSNTPQEIIGCNNFISGNDIWYKFSGNGNKTNITFGPVIYSVSVLIFENNGCDTFNCINEWAFYSGASSNPISFISDLNKEYLMVIQSYSDYPGNISFTVECEEAVANDLCSGAYLLEAENDVSTFNSTGENYLGNQNCNVQTNSGIWYTFEGNDSIATISTTAFGFEDVHYLLFEGSCDTLKCLENGRLYDADSLKFKAFSGVNYFILFYSGVPDSEFKILLSFSEAPMNDECLGRLPVFCGDSIQFRPSIYYEDRVNYCTSAENSAWYSFIGDENIVNFSSDYPTIGFNMEIFEKCDTMCSLIQNFVYSYKNSFSLLAKKDKEYVFRLVASYPDDIVLPLNVTCDTIVYDNYTKEKALELDCQIYDIDLKLLPQYATEGCFDYAKKQLWYKFTGNGEIFRIFRSFSGVNTIVTYDDCKIINEINDFGGQFVTELGKEYYLVILLSDSEPLISFSFEIQFDCISNSLELMDKLDKMVIIPNPFKTNTLLQLISSENTKAQLRILSSDGILVKSHNVILTEGMNTIEINDIYNNGVYFVHVITSNHTFEGKMIKID
ncbi:MAG: T9SS type A sorting domain-containing protein [Saprospiraceae bacterium]|nr:T9SS type A sorting domain-containing protein [Saprospiraceae bacterium]